MQGCQKNIFILDQISFFSLRIPKCGWFTYIYIYTGNICILQLKKPQGDVLEQDIELCPFCCFLVNIHIAGEDEANFLWKFLIFHTQGSTINAGVYCDTLKILRRAIQNKRRGMLSRGVVIIHDNARPYTAAATQILITFGWKQFDHPPPTAQT